MWYEPILALDLVPDGGDPGRPDYYPTVTGLTYEAFEPMALSVLERIADEIEERFEVRRLAVVHDRPEQPRQHPRGAQLAVAGHQQRPQLVERRTQLGDQLRLHVDPSLLCR